MSSITQKDREIQRRLRILKHAEETGHVGRTCRYFGIGRAVKLIALALSKRFWTRGLSSSYSIFV
jgi:hypothetical protein